jgi:hypothetical protein
MIDTLSTSPQVFCDNELFNPTRIVRLKSEHDTTDLAAIQHRDRDPVAFYHNFYGSEFSKRAYALGFNFMLGHHVEVLKTILEDQNLRVIYLERENKLAQASSWFRALDDQVWATSNPGQINTKHKLQFRLDSYLLYIREAQTLDFLFKRAVSDRDNVLHVTYAEFSDITTLLGRIASFLEVRNEFTVSNIRKQNQNRIGDRFVNSREVREYLTAINHAHWLGEELLPPASKEE